MLITGYDAQEKYIVVKLTKYTKEKLPILFQRHKTPPSQCFHEQKGSQPKRE